MRISGEGKIGILVGLVALLGGGAIVVAHGPVVVIIGWVMIAVALVGGILLAHHHFERRRMIPLAGMLLFGLAFIVCAAWYYWPTTQPDARVTEVAKHVVPPRVVPREEVVADVPVPIPRPEQSEPKHKPPHHSHETGERKVRFPPSGFDNRGGVYVGGDNTGDITVNNSGPPPPQIKIVGTPTYRALADGTFVMTQEIDVQSSQALTNMEVALRKEPDLAINLNDRAFKFGALSVRPSAQGVFRVVADLSQSDDAYILTIQNPQVGRWTISVLVKRNDFVPTLWIAPNVP